MEHTGLLLVPASKQWNGSGGQTVDSSLLIGALFSLCADGDRKVAKAFLHQSPPPLFFTWGQKRKYLQEGTSHIH